MPSGVSRGVEAAASSAVNRQARPPATGASQNVVGSDKDHEVIGDMGESQVSA